MRKRRAQVQQAASGAFLWVFYAFRSQFRQGLDNLSHLSADCGGKSLPRPGFHRAKCVDRSCFQCHLYIRAESFKAGAIFYFRHITSPIYIV